MNSWPLLPAVPLSSQTQLLCCGKRERVKTHRWLEKEGSMLICISKFFYEFTRPAHRYLQFVNSLLTLWSVCVKWTTHLWSIWQACRHTSTWCNGALTFLLLGCKWEKHFKKRNGDTKKWIYRDISSNGEGPSPISSHFHSQTQKKKSAVPCSSEADNKLKLEES